MHAHTHTTRAVVTTDNCFALSGAHKHGKVIGVMNRVTRISKTPELTAEVSAKQFIKRQLHTTHVGAVGWEPHSSSTTTWAGKVDHDLPVN